MIGNCTTQQQSRTKQSRAEARLQAESAPHGQIASRALQGGGL